MGFVRYPKVMLIVLSLALFVMAQDCVSCQNFNFVIDEDVVYNHILEGHLFRRLTVHNAARCHLMCKDDCLCVSMNYFPQSKENNCELNDANKDMEPAAMKWRQGGNYYDLVRSYTMKDGDKYIPGKHRCVNRCCRPNPCLNGGVCQEICDTHSNRFNCTCPDSCNGLRCEKIAYPMARSCKDIAENGISTSGKYEIFDSVNESFSVHCDLQSEPRFMWTLIQSFSLGTKDFFMGKAFLIDFPTNQDSGKVDWNSYRLSKSRMEFLAKHSTHFRVTCNFPQDGMQYTDYARAKLTDHNLFSDWGRRALCKKYEYINIRGINCSNCTALTKQNQTVAWSVYSGLSKERGCDFGDVQEAPRAERNFGEYRRVNPKHRCTSSNASTTQHWFGFKRDLQNR